MENYAIFDKAEQLLKDYANERQMVSTSSVGKAYLLALECLKYVKGDLERLDFAIKDGCKTEEMKKHYQNLKDANTCRIDKLDLDF